MSAKDLIVKWAEALQGALAEQSQEPELSDGDLGESPTSLRVNSHLRMGCGFLPGELFTG